MDSPSSPTAIPRRTSSLASPSKSTDKGQRKQLHTLPEDVVLSDTMNATPLLPPPNTATNSTSNVTTNHVRSHSTTDNISTNPNSADGETTQPTEGSNTLPVSKAELDRLKEAERARRKSIGSHLIHQKSSTWSASKERILTGPYDYLYGHPGKDIRAQLIAAFNAWLKVPEESLAVITKVVGMLHTASLLVDDVEDSSQLRRGVPVAHSIYGVAQTLNSANYIYFLALAELQNLSNPALAIDIYTTELLNLHRGQGMDLYWRDTLTCPTEDDYLEMVNNKTGGLFRLAVKLMQAESRSCNKDFTPLVNTIGLLFQILDDYRNLQSPTYTANKGLAEDLTEGKFSFPVIHAIRSDTSNLVLLNILKQKTTDDEVKRYAIAYMDRVGSFAYTRKVLRELTRRAAALVEEMETGEPEKGVGTGIRVIIEKMKVERPGSGGPAVGYGHNSNAGGSS